MLNKTTKKIILITLTIISISIVIYYLKITKILNIDNINNFISQFGMVGPIIFILLYIFLILIGFSSAILSTTAGLLFGLRDGYIIVNISSIIGSSIAFYIGRNFENKLKKLEKIKKINFIIKQIRKNAKKNGFTTIFSLRLAFIPYIWLSYLGGLIKELKFKDFFLATFITNLFGSFIFIFLGFSITQSLPIFILGIILLILFNIILKKYNKDF